MANEKVLTQSEKIKAIHSKKGEFFRYLTFTLIVLFVLIIAAIRPTLATIVRINNEIKQKKNIKQQLQTKFNNVNKLNTQFLSFALDYSDLQLIFPDSNDFSLLLANIDPICKRNSFEIMSISFSDHGRNQGQSKTKLKTLTPWYIQLTVKGDLSKMRNLMEDFEDLPMLPTITSLAYTGRTDKKGNTVIQMEIEVYKINKDNFYIE